MQTIIICFIGNTSLLKDWSEIHNIWQNADDSLSRPTTKACFGPRGIYSFDFILLLFIYYKYLFYYYIHTFLLIWSCLFPNTSHDWSPWKLETLRNKGCKPFMSCVYYLHQVCWKSVVQSYVNILMVVHVVHILFACICYSTFD